MLTVHFPFRSLERSFFDFFLLDPLLVSSSVGDGDADVDGFDLSSPDVEEVDVGDDDDARDDGAAATAVELPLTAPEGTAEAAIAPCDCC